MLVPLTAEEGSSRPWALLEMQGELERKDGGSLEEAFDVGTLSVSSSVSAGRPSRQQVQQPTALAVGPSCGYTNVDLEPLFCRGLCCSPLATTNWRASAWSSKSPLQCWTERREERAVRRDTRWARRL